MSDNNKKKTDLSKNKIILLVAVCAVILLLVILVVADSLAGHKMYIENNTDKDITEMYVVFEDYEGNLVDNLYEGSLKAGESYKFNYGSAIKYAGETYECVVYVTFDGEDELQISDGMFNADFDGNIRLRFFKKDGDYYLHTKAGLGLFELTKSTDMDTDIIMYFDENDWDYVLR